MIVVAGEALIDLVPAGDGTLAAHPGGGPYNVARTLGRLEADVAYLGALSTDRFGALLRSELEADGVELGLAASVEAPTTLAVAEVDAHGLAGYRFYSAGTSAPALAEPPALPPLDAFYLGTLGLVFEPIATTLETLVGRLGDDVLVALDPNYRPAAIDDAGAYRARLDRLLARVDVVKVSEEDLDHLEPEKNARREIFSRARRLGAPVALVTLGSEGALVVTADDAVRVTAPPVDVVDTIGAGDAFMGAFLARCGKAELADLDAVVAAAEFACRVAALTCARAGADPPRAADVL